METIRRSWKLQEFIAHKANVNCLAMGHKSQVLATGGDDKKVNLWAIGRQSCLMSLSGHTTPVECVCFGHSEDLVCAGSQTGALKIWDLEAAKLLRTFTGHRGAIKCMDFHPYGDYLTTGSTDSNIKLWDTRKRGCIVTYSSHRFAVNSLQFSPDGQWIASACEDGLVKVWDVRVGKVLQEFAEHTAAVNNVRFHPHEFLLASCGNDKTINFWDMEKFQLVSKFQKENTSVRAMIFSDDGATLLGCGNDGLHVVGWEPARTLDSVPGHWGQIHDVTVAQTQLIAGSFHSAYVVLTVVDLNKVHPFGGPLPTSPTYARESSPFQKGQSVRKSFSKERPPKPVLHRSTPLEEKTAEESTSGTEADEDSGAVISNITDYTEIFRPSRALNRTPPPAFSMSSEDYSIPGEEELGVGTSLRDLLLEEPTRPSPQPSPPQRQRPDLHSRIPTANGAHTYGSLFSRMDDCMKENTPRSVVTSPIRDYAANFTSSSLNRHNSYKETKSGTDITNSNLRQSNSEISLGPPSLGPRSLSFTRVASETTSTNQTRRRLDSVGRDTRERVEYVPTQVTPRTAREMRERDVRDRDVRDHDVRNRDVRDRDVRNQDVRDRNTRDTRERDVRPVRDSRPEPPEPEFVPCAVDRPVGLDLDEFLPRTYRAGVAGMRGARSGGVEPSEQEVLGIMMRGHDAMMAVLQARERALQIFNSIRINKDLNAALDSAIALDDISVIVDLLNVMAQKPSVWNLDICLLMLPKIYDLLQSKYESYMQCGCNALRLIVRNFSSVVRTNISAPVRTLGVDIPREERYNKCVQIHHMLVEIRGFLLKRQTMQGRLGAAFRDLHTLMQQGLD